MRATRKVRALEGLVARMEAGAELRLDPARERAFLRDQEAGLAAIVTWTEAGELGRRVPQVLYRRWHGYLCFRARRSLPPAEAA